MTSAPTIEPQTPRPSAASCPSCAGKVTVGFGPHGFLATCKTCNWRQHLDDMMEPVQAA